MNEQQILVVEDNQITRKSLARLLLNSGYQVHEAGDGCEALEVLKKESVALVLTDLCMPRMDGFDLLKEINDGFNKIPVIVVSGVGATSDVIRALRLGAWDYLTKPVDDLDILLHQVRNVLERSELLRSKELFHEYLEQEVKKKTTALKVREQELQKALVAIIEVIDSLVEKKDPYTAGHARRVASLATAIGKEMDLTEKQLEGLRLGATIHDLGKIAIPSEILAKPGKLSDPEFQLVKTHAEVGFDILEYNKIKFPWPLQLMVHQHHERIDGSGYPAGIYGEDMLLESRIIAVSDVVEAMATHRPYRPALGVDMALEEIRSHRGKRYDADVVDICLRLFAENHFTFS